MEPLTVLVTGAGALLGQGVLRCLRMSRRQLRILTADPDYLAPGHWLGDGAFVIPMAESVDFIPRVEEIIAREKVAILFIGTDVELKKLSVEQYRLKKVYGVQVVVSPFSVIEIADDKWLTAQFLKNEGFPYPLSAQTCDKKSIEELLAKASFPLFSKPRVGARSKGVELVPDQRTLQRICAEHENYVIQELLPENQGEYTVGCLVLENRCRSVVVLRRDLRDGNTCRAYSDLSGRFEPLMAKIAERLGVEGPVNFQFRLRNGEPVIFEINARFSGTTPIRAVFGFNEVDALLDYYFDNTMIPAPILREGAVFKIWSDIFIGPGQLEQLKTSGQWLGARAPISPI